MSRLQILPSQLANMIAAGEVVQRPASVVKELMENAIDAGASEINVNIIDSGRTLIQVIDNGCGMSPSDAVLCFERHATSKIASQEDLQQILTYGFRGEALASIAAVSQVTLKTRRSCDQTAIQVQIAGTNEVKTSSVAAPIGSNFSVRNLFFNTPARRKFLKSDSAELRQIIAEFSHIAITRPSISFSLSSGDKDIYVLKPVKSLKMRVMDLMGSTLVNELIDIDTPSSVAQISGFIGRPDASRKTPGNQYFFVNGRYFKSGYLHKAVMNAYEEMIPQGNYPSYILFLKCNPESVDVNISPTKSEVKFEEEAVLFQIITAVVRENLAKISFGTSIDFDTADTVEIPQIGSSYNQYKPNIEIPQSSIDSEFNPFEFNPQSHYVDKKENYGTLFEDNLSLSTKVMIINDGRYILSPTNDGIMVVNTHRANERILYDNCIKALNGTAHISSISLFPLSSSLTPDQILVFEENQNLLIKLGFDIRPEDKGVAVYALPDGFSNDYNTIDSLVADILYILSEQTNSLSELVNQRVAEHFASLGSMHSNKLSSNLQAQKLLDTLFASTNAEFTSNGRRIVSIISMEDVDKLFI